MSFSFENLLRFRRWTSWDSICGYGRKINRTIFQRNKLPSRTVFIFTYDYPIHWELLLKQFVKYDVIILNETYVDECISVRLYA